MRVAFGTGFDSGVWPGPLGTRDGEVLAAAFDEAWVGPLGLLKILETQLGLGGVLADSNPRSAQLFASVPHEVK